MVFANLAAGIFRLPRMVVRLLVVNVLRIRGFPCFKAHRDAVDRTCKEQQLILG
jgi:hypothetical protein